MYINIYSFFATSFLFIGGLFLFSFLSCQNCGCTSTSALGPASVSLHFVHSLPHSLCSLLFLSLCLSHFHTDSLCNISYLLVSVLKSNLPFFSRFFFVFPSCSFCFFFFFVMHSLKKKMFACFVFSPHLFHSRYLFRTLWLETKLWNYEEYPQCTPANLSVSLWQPFLNILVSHLALGRFIYGFYIHIDLYILLKHLAW